jgi:hypothetical protein
MSDAGWRATRGMGSNGHEKHCEMAQSMWRAKMAILQLKILCIHGNADERKPYEESLWKFQSRAMRG